MKGIVVVLALCLAGCSRDASGPVAPLTVREAETQVDTDLIALNWAVQDGWLAGGRDVMVGVVVDTAMAPRLFAVARPMAPGADSARVQATLRPRVVHAVGALQRSFDLAWSLGSRGSIGYVTDAPSLPPHYFRLPR